MPSLKSLALALVGSVVFAWFVSACTFSYFPYLRVRPVKGETAPVAGVLRVTTNARQSAPPADWAAVIVNVSNNDAAAAPVTISLDGRVICERSVAASASDKRIDCAIAQTSLGAAHEISVASRAASWTVDAVEIATHHGRSTGPVTAVIVPIGSSLAARTAPGVVALFAVAMFALICCSSIAVPRWSRIGVRVLSVLAAVIAAAAVAAPLLAPYRVLISTGTVAGWMLVIAAPRLAVLLIRLLREARTRVRPLPRLPAGWQAPIAAVVIGLVVAWAFWFLVSEQAGKSNGNYSRFIQINEMTFDADPLVNKRDEIRNTLFMLNPGGYDGQFMYLMAFDPVLTKLTVREYVRFLDEPTYRYGRIGFSWLITAAGLGQPSRYPTVMMWLLIASIFGGAYALARLAQRLNRSAAWGLLILVVPSFWQSLFAALPESLAAALMIVGYLQWRRGNAWAATAALAYALLVRETVVIFALCLIVAAWRSPSWRRDRVLLLALVPVALWRIYVDVTFMPAFGWEAFTRTSPVVGVPFGGMAHVWSLIQQGKYFGGDPPFVRGTITLALLQSAGLVVAAVLLIRRRDPVFAAAFLYSCLTVSFNFQQVWVHVGNAQRVSYEMFVMLALAAVIEPVTTTLGRMLAGFWVLAAAFVFAGAFDAHYAQETLPGLAVFALLWLALRNRLPRLIFRPGQVLQAERS